MALEEVTVAVRVMVAPALAGLGDAVSVIEVDDMPGGVVVEGAEELPQPMQKERVASARSASAERMKVPFKAM